MIKLHAPDFGKNNSMEIGNSGGTVSHLFALIKGLVVMNDGNEAGKMV